MEPIARWDQGILQAIFLVLLLKALKIALEDLLSIFSVIPTAQRNKRLTDTAKAVELGTRGLAVYISPPGKTTQIFILFFFKKNIPLFPRKLRSDQRIIPNQRMSWGRCSVAQHLPSMHKALGLSRSPRYKKIVIKHGAAHL